MSAPISPKAQSQSPRRSPKSSPIRRPLHERSDSQVNQMSRPTIRLVDDHDTQVYAKTPFPRLPSQILRPHKAHGYVFEDQGDDVSDELPTTNALSKLVPEPLRPRKNRDSTSTLASDAPTLTNRSTFSPSSNRFSQGTTPQSSEYADDIPSRLSRTIDEDEWMGKGLGVLQEEPDPSEYKTIRAVIPSSSTASHTLVSKASQTSLASSASSDTLTTRKHEDRRASTNTFPSSPPPRNRRRPSSAGSRSSKQASATRKVRQRRVLNGSKDSLVSFHSSNGSNDRPRSASTPTTPTHAALKFAVEAGAKIQYPVIKAPSASGSRAETSQPSFATFPRMKKRPERQQWDPRLSMIPPEPEHASGSIHTATETSAESPQARRRRTVGSANASIAAGIPSTPSQSTVQIPPPLFSASGTATGRDSDERDDTLPELQSPPLKQQRSGFLSRFSLDSRPSSRTSSQSDAQSDRGFYSGFTFPAWARSYYRHGSRVSLSALASSTDVSHSRLPTATTAPTDSPMEEDFPSAVHRPRNRPHQGAEATDSMLITDAPVEHEVVAGPTRRHVSDPFTPRLQRDRRSNARLSAWKAPSFDETLGGLLFSRGNRQILLFCLGFIFPIAWIIAAFLPLPMRPGLPQGGTPSQMDVERTLARDLDPIDEKRYQKARWWRVLNRIMSVAGLGIIAAVLALAVVASHV